jgi:hypothetical protein
MEITRAKTSTQICELTCVNNSAASAIPARSAPTLIVLAARSAVIATTSTDRGNLDLNAAVSPHPDTMPIRAHIICTPAIKGHVISAVHRRFVPS